MSFFGPIWSPRFEQVHKDTPTPRPVACDNCPWEGDESALQPIDDIGQRLDAGGEVPAGQCPECGALAYLLKGKVQS